MGKSGTAHGGVGFFFDKAKCDFKKFPLNALRGLEVRDFEILCCRGRMNGVKREIVTFTCDLPPGMNKKKVEAILESLTDAISEAKAKSDCPWLIIAGDWNRYDTRTIHTMYPDITVHKTGPTRGNATLDYVLTNFEAVIVRSQVCFPVELAKNASDHAMVLIESNLERPVSFVWETHEYLKNNRRRKNSIYIDTRKRKKKRKSIAAAL